MLLKKLLVKLAIIIQAEIITKGTENNCKLNSHQKWTSEEALSFDGPLVDAEEIIIKNRTSIVI